MSRRVTSDVTSLSSITSPAVSRRQQASRVSAEARKSAASLSAATAQAKPVAKARQSNTINKRTREPTLSSASAKPLPKKQRLEAGEKYYNHKVFFKKNYLYKISNA